MTQHERHARQVAKIVRLAAEREFYQAKGLKNRCLVVSYVFRRCLRPFKVPNHLVGGYYQTILPTVPLKFGDPASIAFARNYPTETKFDHCWLEIEGKIWDLTLTQFEADAKPISILPDDDPRYVSRIHYKDDSDDEEARCSLALIQCEDLAHALMCRIAKRCGGPSKDFL